MTPAELERAIERGGLPPLLYLYGEETFSLERTLWRLIAAGLPEEARDFNLTWFTGRTTAIPELLDTVQTLPVFATQRIVIVKDAQQLAAADLDRLLPYLHKPVAETLLVFVADKIDARRKFFIDFKKHGELVEFKKLSDHQLPDAIKGLAKNEGLTLTDQALAIFSRKVSASLQDIHMELLKLAAYVGERRLADVADVEAVVITSRQETIFAFCDAVGERNTVRSLQFLGNLLEDGAAPLLVLSMLVRHQRNLWKLRELQEQKRPRPEMVKAAGVNPYFLDKLLRQAGNFSTKQLRAVFEQLLATDLALKSSAAHPEALLEKLVISICKQDKGGP